MSSSERWQSKLKAAADKASRAAAKEATPMEVRASKSRMKADEARSGFDTWLSNLAPGAGAQNEFRTMLYRNELRTLDNRRRVNSKMEQMKRYVEHLDEMRPAQPKYPGIQLFFQNTVDHSPLVAPEMRGGALTQLPRSETGYRKVEQQLIDLAKEQARFKTSNRLDMPLRETPPPVVTGLDEAKLAIGTELETIGQQLMRGIYSLEVLRDLTRLMPTVARNAPLLSADNLLEINRYVADVAQVMRLGAKNIAKEIADDAEEEAADVAGAEGVAPGAEEGSLVSVRTRDIPYAVDEEAQLPEAIYERLVSLSEFLKRQSTVANRGVRERVAMAQSNLPLLGLSADRKKYPKEALALIAKNEAEEAEKQRRLAEGAEEPPEEAAAAAEMLPALDVVDLEGMPMAEGAPMRLVGMDPAADIAAMVADMLARQGVGPIPRADDAVVLSKAESSAVATQMVGLQRSGQFLRKTITPIEKAGPLANILNAASQRAGKGLVINPARGNQTAPLNVITTNADAKDIYLTDTAGNVFKFSDIFKIKVDDFAARFDLGAAAAMEEID